MPAASATHRSSCAGCTARLATGVDVCRRRETGMRQGDQHKHCCTTHRPGLWAHYCGVALGRAPAGLFTVMCVDTLFPVMAVLEWAAGHLSGGGGQRCVHIEVSKDVGVAAAHGCVHSLEEARCCQQDGGAGTRKVAAVASAATKRGFCLQPAKALLGATLRLFLQRISKGLIGRKGQPHPRRHSITALRICIDDCIGSFLWYQAAS